jgi:DNA-binding transcriptional LysR family regulator
MIGHMDIAGFDLNLMKAFDALYAERHVTRAGSRIGLSQSAMSGALTRLRELLGDELFVRTPSGMQPTPRAHDLAGPVSDVLRLLRSALQADSFDPATADNTVTLAMTDYAAFAAGPSLKAFAAAPHLLVSPEGDRSGIVDLRLADLGLERRVVLSLPQFLAAPFVIAGTDLVVTLASRIARKFADTGAGIAMYDPPLELPTWPLHLMWHRRADTHRAIA